MPTREVCDDQAQHCRWKQGPGVEIQETEVVGQRVSEILVDRVWIKQHSVQRERSRSSIVLQTGQKAATVKHLLGFQMTHMLLLTQWLRQLVSRVPGLTKTLQFLLVVQRKHVHNNTS